MAINRILTFQRVPLQTIVITAGISYICQLGGMIQGWPLWALVLATLLPWVPLFFFEALWKHKHYGAFALFIVIAVLQVGHLSEHAAQVFQLAVLGWPLTCPPPPGVDAACGVFGFLDLETIHFVWDTGVWLGTLALVYTFGTRNPWLMLSLAAATAHEVEHMFIFYAYVFNYPFYENGGKNGVFGTGGYIPLLWRPLLHFGYNTLVVVPLVIALFYQLRKVYDEYLKEALPQLGKQTLVNTSGQLQAQTFPAGADIVNQGDRADRFYIIARGEVEVLRERDDGTQASVARLGPGQYFGEIGLLMNARRTATVRAMVETEVLFLDRQAFRALVDHSEPMHMEMDLVVRQRLRALEGAAGPLVAPNWQPARLCRQGSREEIILENDLELIGRGSGNTIVLHDPTISRRHALLQRDGSTWWMESISPSTVTWLNWQPVEERRALQDGDVLTLGETSFVFRASAAMQTMPRGALQARLN